MKMHARTSDAIARTLLARLDYTRIQRGIQTPAVNDERFSWFLYKVYGIRTGLHEGVFLGIEEEFCLDRLERVADNIGATLFKLTRPTPGPIVMDDIYVQQTRRWTVVRRAARAREVLPLAPTYDQTLAGLGRHTRRNIRAARRIAAAEGFGFEISTVVAPLMSPAERAELTRTATLGAPTAVMARLEAYVDQIGTPFRTVLRAADGKVMSYSCGYFGDLSIAYLLYQLNDADFNPIGPSLMHRAFLLEWLTQLGYTEFVFVHGCSGILGKACFRQAMEEVWLMRRSLRGYITGAILGLFMPNTSIGRLARLGLRPRAVRR